MKVILAVGAILAALFLFLACAGPPTPAAPPPPPSSTPTPSLFPLTVTDSNGEEVILQRPPQRIVAIDAAAVEVLFAIGQGHRLVGTHDFVAYPPEAEAVQRVGSGFALNFEKIAAMEPDLITTIFEVPDLHTLGAPVLYLQSPHTLAGITHRVRLWGRIVGSPGVALEQAEAFEESVRSMKARVSSSAAVGSPRVFFLGDPTLWTSGAGTLIQEILTLLGAKNIFEDVSGFKQVSAEEIVARDPEVVLGVYSVGPDPLEVVRDNPALRGVSAARKGRVFRVDADLLDIAGPRVVQGVEEIARLLYPDRF